MATKEKKKGKAQKCLTCHNKAKSRKLCERCGALLKGRIARGELTEHQAIGAGLIAPVQRLGRPAKGGMARALEHLAATK